MYIYIIKLNNMKHIKHFFTFSIMLVSTLGFTQSGSIYLGGTAGFNVHTIKDSDNKSSDWSFSPEVSTFLSDNLQVGVGLKVRGSKDEIVGVTDYTVTTIETGATLYARNFFAAGSTFRPFIGLNIDALPGKITTETGSIKEEEKTFTLGVNLNAGFGYWISPKWMVVGSFAALGFETTSQKHDGSDNKTVVSDFGLNINTLGNRFTIGFYYML